MINQSSFFKKNLTSLSPSEGWIALTTVILVAVIVKCIMIGYGLPYQTHVDEMTILKDPFKLLIGYSQGDFSHSTNLYNWLLTGWFSLFFLGGLLSGHWSGLEEFKTFLISDSYELLFFGRLLSLILSTVAIWVLLQLVSRITKRVELWWVFALMIVFNPIDLNSTNWIKFDAPAFLAYAIILYLAHIYFIEGVERTRGWLYFMVILGLSVRIEIISYLLGVSIYDLFFFRKYKKETFLVSMKFLVKPALSGIAVYLTLTLLPVSVLYNLFYHQSDAAGLVTTPTFEEAILSKIPTGSGLIESVKNSVYYFYSFLALLGPIIFLAVVIEIKNKRYGFLYITLFIMLLFLLIFPSKGTHYLLNVSILSIYISILFIEKLSSRLLQLTLVLISLIWMMSFSFIQLWFIQTTGDVRIQARDYLLSHSSPTDQILYEGVFSQIYDKPVRYKLKAEAAKEVGSTGLSNEYLARHLSDEDTRFMQQVFYYDGFAGTKYEGVFTNNYNIDSVLHNRPKFFVYVGQYFGQIEFNQTAHYPYHIDFYEKLKKYYKVEKIYDYPSIDKRLLFATSYYFRPVVIYRLDERSVVDQQTHGID